MKTKPASSAVFAQRVRYSSVASRVGGPMISVSPIVGRNQPKSIVIVVLPL
jgi:hypothetical protein